MSSSRRKQSNPKPLKLEDEFCNEGEDGAGKRQPKSEPKEEEEGREEDADTVDGGGNPEVDPENNNNNDVEVDNEDEDRSSFHSADSQQSRKSGSQARPRIKAPKNHHSEPIRRIGFDLSTKIQPPMDPLLFTNAQQLIQAGYFHLLPPDAARLLLLQSNLPPELTAATIASLNSGESGEQQPQPGRNPTPNPNNNNNNNNNNTKLDKDNSRGLLYTCEPCGIKFSSVRTLEAHQTYYCASRKEIDKEGVPSGSADGKTSGELESSSCSGESLIIKGIKRELGVGDEDPANNEPGTLVIDESQSSNAPPTPAPAPTDSPIPDRDPASKSLKTGKLYSCSHCSYSADKKVSLNRHMRIHSGGGGPVVSHGHGTGDENEGSPIRASSSTPASLALGMGEGITAADRYCFECEIQFSSLKTFKVHKQYYCSTRHVLKASQPQTTAPLVKGESQLSLCVTSTSPHRSSGTPKVGSSEPGVVSPLIPEGNVSPLPQQQQQPFVILPTNPIMIVPYCFIQGASLVPGSLVPSQNALVVLPNGSVQCLPGTNFQQQFGTLSNVSNEPSNMSPTTASGIFNDPKEVIRRIISSSHELDKSSHSPRRRFGPRRSERESFGSEECDQEEEAKFRGGGESESPAIDLTLRSTLPPAVEEDEKENHQQRSFTPSIHSHSHSPCTIGSGSSCSGVQQRTKRPSSTMSSSSSGGGAQSSSCTSPPVVPVSESRINGLKMMSSPGSVSVSRLYGFPGESHVPGSKVKSRKISPIPQSQRATQLPGGAILTSTSTLSQPNQSLAELLQHGGGGAVPDSHENLLKFLPGGTSGSAADLLAHLPQELAMSYLASLQHSLQKQQQQQGFSGSLSPPSAPPAPTGPLLKRGIWKCLDCEIVYYKHENYIVHKEQYCAFRNKAEKQAEDSPTEPQIKHSPVLSLSSSQSPSPQSQQRTSPDSSTTIEIKKSEPTDRPDELNGQSPLPPDSTNTKHPCSKCGVGFKTLDNLSAHQAFYCRAGISASDSLILENNNGLCPEKSVVEKASSNGFGRCGNCKLSIPEEQMSLHRNLCNGATNGIGRNSSATGSGSPVPASNNNSGWKCPCCDTYSPTMAAAQKHLETHTGIRAFKCLICGYRGNTLRGMRTHIRMHFDKRVSDLQEGDYISCITSTDLDAGNGRSNSNGLPGTTGAAAAGAVGNGALTNTRRRNRVTLLG